ncbi:MAG TPA: zinc-binding alcohol dehydrogenase family protein [Bryobacteraceae bacterium]|nr:zinc-binding alcohol dehydrogenase family protein [Bryobacteraceae bacterium]
MNAAVLHALNQTPRRRPFPEPVAAPGESLIEVRAAALKPVDAQMANGSHYAAFREFPVICGTDGVGCLADGTRVYFAGPRPPYGSMAERTVVGTARCFPLPASVDDITAAALFNPGLSAWGALQWRAQLAPGENVLILGATGVTGKLAIQTARLLGARRVAAAGRNQEVLRTLPDLGADAVIGLNQPVSDLTAAFAREGREHGFDVIIDYLWGAPTEALLAAVARQDLKPAATRTRLVQVGESAGPVISLPAAVLRSSRLEILGAGTGNAPASLETWQDAIRRLLANVASGALRIDCEPIALADIEQAWPRDQRGRRMVVLP